MADIIKEINEYVSANGVGAHFEYTDTGRKIKDKEGDNILIIDNTNVFYGLLELLTNNAQYFIGLTNFSGGYDAFREELESYYYVVICDIAPHYQDSFKMTFCNFFIQELRGKFMDMYKKERIIVKKNEEDNEKYTEHSVSKHTGYTMTNEDGEEQDRKELEYIEQGYSDFEESGRVFEIALQIVRILSSLKKSKQYMSRLFFTDSVIYWIEGEKDPRNIRVKHAREVFENLDKKLVDYLMAEDTNSLADIMLSDRKTLYQLYVFLDELIKDFDIVSVYKEKFNAYKLDPNDKTQIPQIPLGNNMFLAYMYAADSIALKDTNEKPVMHPSSYITKYQDEYNGILREFLNLS